LHVPKLRRGNGALPWQSITRYERCWGPLLDHQVMSYCLGHSLHLLYAPPLRHVIYCCINRFRLSSRINMFC
jgi:hypothetical protein